MTCPCRGDGISSFILQEKSPFVKASFTASAYFFLIFVGGKALPRAGTGSLCETDLWAAAPPFCRAGLRPACRLCGGAPPSTPPGVTAGPCPHFPRGYRGWVETGSLCETNLGVAFGGPSRWGRFAPRTPRPYLSTAKDRGESSPRGHPPWQSPWGTPLLLGKRSRSARPCPTGTKPHQARECLSRRQPPKIVPCRGS